MSDLCVFIYKHIYIMLTTKLESYKACFSNNTVSGVRRTKRTRSKTIQHFVLTEQQQKNPTHKL